MNSIQEKQQKEAIYIRLDRDVIEAFKRQAEQTGSKYQTLINKALREAIEKDSVEQRLERLEKALLKE